MFKFLPLAALLLSAALVAPAQTLSPPTTEAAEPFQKANVVMLYLSNAPAEAYQLAGQQLLSTGWSLDKTDAVLHYLTTSYRTGLVGSFGLRMQLSVRPQLTGSGSVVEVRGFLSGPGAGAAAFGGSGEQRVDCRGMKGSPARKAWEALLAATENYPGARRAFRQQP